MIDNLKVKLKDIYNITVEEKVLLFGFSASANFIDKLSCIHPEMIEAMAMGGTMNMFCR